MHAGAVTYSGAVGRISIADLLKLGSGWAVQEKFDGSYCHVHLDARGRIAEIILRSGKPYKGDAPNLYGALVGRPHSILVGELEAFTESATRIVATNGYRRIHLFDCLRDGVHDISHAHYGARRDALYRAQSELVSQLYRLRDANGDAHDRTTGRYVEDLPTDWRLTPIVDQIAPARAGDLWERARVSGDVEGLVAVRLDARLAARRAKLKCKPVDTIDAVVVGEGKGVYKLVWAGSTFFVSRSAHDAVKVGAVVEVSHNGFYESSTTPRFARLVRVRSDL